MTNDEKLIEELAGALHLSCSDDPTEDCGAGEFHRQDAMNLLPIIKRCELVARLGATLAWGSCTHYGPPDQCPWHLEIKQLERELVALGEVKDGE